MKRTVTILALLSLIAFTVYSQSGVTTAKAAAGRAHAMVVVPDGSLWSWGANAFGQLGDGSTSSTLQPGAVTGISDVRQVATGLGGTAAHSVAVDGDGDVWSWGENGDGQLGDTTTTDRLSPTYIGLTDMVRVAAGHRHSAALEDDGNVWTWGSNQYGQLGHGNYTDSATPVQIGSFTDVTDLDAASTFTVAVKSNGTVWGWGTNGYGELGDGNSSTTASSPVQASGVTSATQVSAGGFHTLIRKGDGTAWGWGRNNAGQLGNGTTTDAVTAVQVSSISGVSTVAAGETHSLALKSDGTVWSWGSNAHGELGDGTTTARTAPAQISGLSDVISIAAGTNFSVAITADGVVFAWGANDLGQVGDGTTIERLTPTPISDEDFLWKSATPTLSVPGGTYNVEQTVTVTSSQSGVDLHYSLSGAEPTLSDPTVASGSTVAVNVSETLKVAGWKTGYARSNTTQATYTLVAVAPNASPGSGTYASAQSVSLSTSTGSASIRYTVDGSTPTVSSSLYSSALSIATGTVLKAITIRSGWTNSSVFSATYVMDFGTVPTPGATPGAATYTTEANVSISGVSGATVRYTTDGNDPTTSSPIYSVPINITTSLTLKFKGWHSDYSSPSAVGSAAYVIQAAAPLVTPGTGTYQPGEIVSVSSPTPGTTMTYTINGVDPTISDTAIASGRSFTVAKYTLKVRAFKTGVTASPVTTATYTLGGSAIAAEWISMGLKPDGTVWGWGQNNFGQIGDNTKTQRNDPTQTSGLTGVSLISTGYHHSLALMSNGTVKGWGENGNGAVGDGTTTDRLTPVSVSSLTDAVMVDAAEKHSLALRATGQVVAWGLNSSGQLGDGSQTQRTSPVAVSGLTGVVAIAAAYNHSLALKSDGTVWGWGENQNGQVGDGTMTDRLTPVQVSSLTNVVAIAANDGMSIALKSDGTAWAWGWNGSGKLGDGTDVDRLSPVQMLAPSNIVGISVGWMHSVLRRADGTVWAAGDNSEGQLGVGGGAFSTTPVQIEGFPTAARAVAGNMTTFVTTSDGTAWALGKNATGEIGDGTTIRRTSPIQLSGPGLEWRAKIPTISLAAGQYLVEKTTVITSPTAGATLRYTTDGTTPTGTSTTFTSGATMSVTQSISLVVRAFKTGAPPSESAAAAYDLKVPTPSWSPPSGAFTTTQTVTGSTAASTTLHYTQDGSTPTVSSPAYSAPLSVDHTQLLKAVATRSGWTSSDLVTASFWILGGSPLDAPSASPGTGTYVSEVVVTLMGPTGAVIRVTLDGSEPTEASVAYERPLLLTRTTALKAKAFQMGHTASTTFSATYTISTAGFVDPPALSVAGGRYTTKRVVAVTGPAGATLRYTTTGIDPTTSDSTIASGSTITVDQPLVLKVRAWQTGLEPSQVARADYIITGAIAAGINHSLAVKAEGTVWTWGDNGNGQIGDGLTADRTSPIQVFTNAIEIAAGYNHNVVLKNDGTVWAWGLNSQGEIGDNTTTMRRSPVQVSGLTNVVAVAAGNRNSYAVKADGTLWAWGFNSTGQIGDGTSTRRLVPVQVQNIIKVQAVAAGSSFALALISNGGTTGSVWAWGRNDVGQLGDGSTSDRWLPQQVLGVEAARVFAGDSYAMARTSDGGLQMWGSNNSFELGNDTVVDALTPLSLVPWMNPVVEIGGGQSHVFAIRGRDMSLWGWGLNMHAQMAESASSQWKRMPGVIAAFSAASAAIGGLDHSVAVDLDGQVWTWGENSNGQLGVGSTTDTVTPLALSSFFLSDYSWLNDDADADGLVTRREYQLGTDPLLADTDGDGIPDGAEVFGPDSSPNMDPDGDGISTALETARGTDPYEADSDGDGVNDRLDAFPLDPDHSSGGSFDPDDHTPPIITLIEPTNAVPVP